MDHRLKLVKYLIEQKDHKESVNTIFRTILGKLAGNNIDTTKGANTEHTVRLITAIKSLGTVHSAQRGLGVFVDTFGELVGKNANERGHDSKIIKLNDKGQLETKSIEIKGLRSAVGKRLAVPEISDVDKLRGFEPDTEITVGAVPTTVPVSWHPDSLNRRIANLRSAAREYSPTSQEFLDKQGKTTETIRDINANNDVRQGTMDIALRGILGNFILKGPRSVVYSVPNEIVKQAVKQTGTLKPPYFESQAKTATIQANATLPKIFKVVDPQVLKNLEINVDELGVLSQYVDRYTLEGITNHLESSNALSR
jgi:hypothetical protein